VLVRLRLRFVTNLKRIEMRLGIILHDNPARSSLKQATEETIPQVRLVHQEAVQAKHCNVITTT